jgi:hypothetical protein
MGLEKEVELCEDVEIFLDELLVVLYGKNYFSFPDDAEKYVKAIVKYIEYYTGILPGTPAPAQFTRYGKDMKYITYRANKATQWYIFYQQSENVFLIRHITNNHVAAQYF